MKTFTCKEVPALWGVGALGHTWVTLHVNADGTRHTSGHTSTGSDAVRLEEYNHKGEPYPADKIAPYEIYTAIPTKRGNQRWRLVSRAAAVMDGPGLPS